jgi:hypothetical protein
VIPPARREVYPERLLTGGFRRRRWPQCVSFHQPSRAICRGISSARRSTSFTSGHASWPQVVDVIEQSLSPRNSGTKRTRRSAAATPTTSRACASTAASDASASTAGTPAGWCCEAPSDRGRPAPSSERALDDSHPFRHSSCGRPPPERGAGKMSIPVAFMALAVASLRRGRGLLGRQG